MISDRLLAQPLQRRPRRHRPDDSPQRTKRDRCRRHTPKFDGALTANPVELFVPTTVRQPSLRNSAMTRCTTAASNPSSSSCALLPASPSTPPSLRSTELPAASTKTIPRAAAGRQSQARCPDGRGHARADSPRAPPQTPRLLRRAHGHRHRHRLPQSRHHGARARHQPPQRVGHPPRASAPAASGSSGKWS